MGGWVEEGKEQEEKASFLYALPRSTREFGSGARCKYTHHSNLGYSNEE
jgi:hypothetical protein